MKKLLFVATVALAALASCNQKNPNQVNLVGTTDLADGEQLLVFYQSGDSMLSDTITVSGGAFAFSTVVDGPSYATIINGDMSMNNKKSRRLYLEPGDITISLSGDDYTSAPVTGSKSTAEMDDAESRTKSIYDRMRVLRDSIMKYQGNDEVAAPFAAEYDSLQQVAPSIQKAWVKENPDAIYGAQMMSYLLGRMDLSEMKEIYNNWTPQVQANAAEMKAEIDVLESIQPGMPAPDITGNNPQGNPIKLSDLKGHVVLLDFWATWCGPCRASFPHINALYNKYKEKGFEVFMVADNDNDPDNWREYIVNDKVEAYHHVLRGLKIDLDADGNFAGYDDSNDQSKKYAVHYLPTKFLIGADGKIVGKVNDEELDAKLKQIYGE